MPGPREVSRTEQHEQRNRGQPRQEQSRGQAAVDGSFPAEVGRWGNAVLLTAPALHRFAPVDDASCLSTILLTADMEILLLIFACCS